MIHLTIESIDLLADAIISFEKHCLKGVHANAEKLRQNLDQSLMLVAALSPEIGYDVAEKIAKHAHKQGTTLRQAAIELNLLSAEEFDAMVIPESMLGPEQILK
jgi:fumarate hydratase class II